MILTGKKFWQKSDGARITPVFLFTAGTQSFGFNTSYQSSFTNVRANFLPGNQKITDMSKFQIESISFVLRGSYVVKKFFLMSQFLLDYYIPTTKNHFNTVYAVSIGFNFLIRPYVKVRVNINL